MIKKLNISLILVLVISLFIRLYSIDNLSLFGDEIDVGYQAFSLLNTGRDYKGNFLPVYIQSLAESRAPLLIYTTVPSIALFGLNEIGVRLPPIIFGILSIYFLYKLVLLLTNNYLLSSLTAFVLAVNPWHFHYSRTAFEVTLLLSLILAGTYFIYTYFNSSKNKFLYLSIVSFCLSFYTYNTANIFVPLIIAFIFFTNYSTFKSKLSAKSLIFSFFIFCLFTGPILYQIFFGAAANRFNLISIFHNQNLIDQIVTKRTTFSATTPTIEAIFHNKPITWANEFFKNYLSSFSLPFLFIYGDQSNIRHSVPGFGLVYLIFLPFLLYGLFKTSLKDKLGALMFFWLTIAPVASSLTIGGANHATRLFLMVAPLTYFVSLGVAKLINNKHLLARLSIIPLFLVLSFQMVGYYHEYFVHYPKDSFESWNRGYKELFSSLPKTSNNIYISNAKYNSLLPFTFYQKYSTISGFLSDNNQANVVYNFSGFNLNQNIYFINDYNQNDHLNAINQVSQSGDIFLLFQLNDIPGDMDFTKNEYNGYQTIKTVYNPNNTILGQIIQKI